VDVLELFVVGGAGGEDEARFGARAVGAPEGFVAAFEGVAGLFGSGLCCCFCLFCSRGERTGRCSALNVVF
jgi:hypothetical protein